MVGRRALDALILVRLQASEQIKLPIFGEFNLPCGSS